MIEASKEVGGATLQELQQQREQITEIEKEVDQMDNNLIRAEKLISNFAKRMATDRIIQMFTAVNIVIMLSLILYVVISGNSLTPGGGSSSSTAGPTVSQSLSFRPTFLPTVTHTTTPTTTDTII
jgi:hypothetical protein